MAAPKGNKYWQQRATHGRDKIFKTPDILWETACEYFQWVEDNPLKESKLVVANGVPQIEEIPKPRAMTIEGLCVFIGCTTMTWREYAAREDFIVVTRQVAEVMRAQKFEGAAAGQFNANIIARDLGLREATTNEHSGPDGKPIEVDQTFTIEFVNAPSSD